MSDISQKQHTGAAMTIRHNVQKMHSLPEQQRKIFAILSMIGATFGIGLLFLTFFNPLEQLDHSSSQSMIRQENAALFEGLSSDTSHQTNNSIPQITPMRGFLDSFDAVKNLFVPHDIKTESGQANISDLWSTPLSELPQLLFRTIYNFLQFVISVIKSFINDGIAFVRGYAPGIVDSVLTFLNQIKTSIVHVIQLIIYFFTLSFQQIAHVISSILDRLISRMGVSIY